MRVQTLKKWNASAGFYQFIPDRPPHGYMPWRMGAFHTDLIGGPYYQRPLHRHIVGVNLAAEIGLPAEVAIPTGDFDVPCVDMLYHGLMNSVLWLASGKMLYIGCRGGIGRTGLFMAAMAKLMFTAHTEYYDWYVGPIEYVRATYKGTAVETPQQKELIESLDLRMLAQSCMQILDKR